MIQAIIFDYGNVIARFDHAIFYNTIARHSSLPLDELKALARHQYDLLLRYETGGMTSDEFCSVVMEVCRVSMTRDEFQQAFVDIFERIPATIELVKQLKPHYKLGLLSNTNEWHFQGEMQTLDIFPLFDAVTLSYHVGALKPDERMYRDMLHKLSLPPESCLYIDDIADYVAAAQRLGIRALHYTTHEDLLSSLRELGVRVSGYPPQPLARRRALD